MVLPDRRQKTSRGYPNLAAIPKSCRDTWYAIYWHIIGLVMA